MFSSNTVLLSVFTQTLEIWNTPIGNFSGQRSQDNLKKKKKKDSIYETQENIYN